MLISENVYKSAERMRENKAEDRAKNKKQRGLEMNGSTQIKELNMICQFDIVSEQLESCNSVLIDGITTKTKIKKGRDGNWIGFHDEKDLVQFIA